MHVKEMVEVGNGLFCRFSILAFGNGKRLGKTGHSKDGGDFSRRL